MDRKTAAILSRDVRVGGGGVWGEFIEKALKLGELSVYIPLGYLDLITYTCSNLDAGLANLHQ